MLYILEGYSKTNKMNERKHNIFYTIVRMTQNGKVFFGGGVNGK
jgi:hypothetical protein